MDLKEAKELAEKLMLDHNLIGWSFKFDSANARFGLCRHTKKTISLSKFLVSLNTVERVTNTILHEIAHAILGPGYGHSKVWKQKAIEIGCNGKTGYDHTNTIIPPSKHNYIYKCKHCGKEIIQTYRSHRVLACVKCCEEFNNGYYDVKYGLEYQGERTTNVNN